MANLNAIRLRSLPIFFDLVKRTGPSMMMMQNPPGFRAL